MSCEGQGWYSWGCCGWRCPVSANVGVVEVDTRVITVGSLR